MSTEPLFDVVIVEFATGIIESLPGKDMRKDTGYYNAERRLETVVERINSKFFAAIVPAGKYQKGDKWEVPV